MIVITVIAVLLALGSAAEGPITTIGITPTLIQLAGTGLPLVSIAQINYDATMGICVPADSPIVALSPKPVGE